MIFFYHPLAGEKKILLENDFFRYLILSRRHRVGDKIFVRNLKNLELFSYEVSEIGKKKAFLCFLEKSQEKAEKNLKNFHLAWGICDVKTITKTLPALNELGVVKISFIWCERSQKVGKISQEKLEKILISSCEQCGRKKLMEIEFFDSLSQFFQENSEVKILDFGGKTLSCPSDKKSAFLVGPEGGFSENERKIFDEKNIFSFDTDLVLRSETAAMKIASMV